MTVLKLRHVLLTSPLRIPWQHLFIFCLFYFALSTIGWARVNGTIENELLVIGSAPVTMGNIAVAREEAIAQAMAKAVGDYLAARLGETGMINNFERLVREILPTAKEGIENFHILARHLDVDKYRVLVKVRINREMIEEALRLSGITTLEAPNIRILFMVSEVMNDELSYWWKGPETSAQMTQTDVILYRVFQDRGFNPVNRSLGTSDMAYSESMTAPRLETPDLVQWGKLFSADVVITGRTVFLDESRVFMTLKAISVKKAEELFEATETGLRDLEAKKTVTADLLLEKVARKLVRKLAPSIALGTSRKPERLRLFQVQLKGLRSFREYRALKDFLKKEVTGVQSVKESRIGGGVVTLTVAFEGKKASLVGRILDREGIPVKLALEKSQDNEIVLSVEE